MNLLKEVERFKKLDELVEVHDARRHVRQHEVLIELVVHVLAVVVVVFDLGLVVELLDLCVVPFEFQQPDFVGRLGLLGKLLEVLRREQRQED